MGGGKGGGRRRLTGDFQKGCFAFALLLGWVGMEQWISLAEACLIPSSCLCVSPVPIYTWAFILPVPTCACCSPAPCLLCLCPSFSYFFSCHLPCHRLRYLALCGWVCLPWSSEFLEKAEQAFMPAPWPFSFVGRVEWDFAFCGWWEWWWCWHLSLTSPQAMQSLLHARGREEDPPSPLYPIPT